MSLAKWGGMPVAVRAAIALIGVLVITGCGGGGGGDREEAPVSAALVVGTGVDQVSVTVRSGTEIILNGENSDGTRFPIDSANWRQTDGTGIAIALDKRTELTRVAAIPMVDAETTFTFELSIVNTDGDRSITEVVVRVIPVGDGDKFLEYFTAIPDVYNVVAALKPGMSATADVPFTITQRELVNYADRTSNSNVPNQSNLEIGSRQVLASSWLTGSQASWMTSEEAVTAFYHPNFCFTVPKFDLDDINIQFDDTDPDRGIDEFRVDSVEHFVELTLDVSGGTCEDINSAPIDCADAVSLIVVDAAGGVVDPMPGGSDTQRVLAVDTLKASTDPRRLPESAATAAAYYRAVDPLDRRTTLADWLQVAGIANAAGEVVAPPSELKRTLYINNYDLGFTRDMFVRVDPVTDNVYAYVTNFPALRPAIQRDSDEDVIATVVMEYSPAEQDPNGPPVTDPDRKFTKFFVYIPDQSGDGTQVRVNTLNFDGRGEKWVPGACTPCHGGESQALTPFGGDLVYPGHGDLDAAFLPWDLDSFLYVDAANPRQVDPLVTAGFDIDPGYLTAEQLARFSRENQEADFRAMNEMVLSTMVDTSGSDRFDVIRPLIHGWYGNLDANGDAMDNGNELPANNFDGSYIPRAWRESETGVAGLDEFYTEIFGRHCRICHNQIKTINQFGSWDAFLQVSDLTTQYVYQDGTMPNARLDMDRFWVDFHGGDTNAASRLADILSITDVDLRTGPGKPVARIDSAPVVTAVAVQDDSNVETISNQGAVRLDGSTSPFAETFEWTLTDSAGAPTTGAFLVGADTAKPAVRIVLGNEMYTAALTVGKTLSDGTVLSDSTSVTIDAMDNQPKQVLPKQQFTISESLLGDISTSPITQDQLEWTDLDSADPSQIIYTVTTPPAQGVLSANTFTQQDINSGALTYTEGTGVSESSMNDRFFYTVSDADGNDIPGNFFDIAVVLRNDIPVEVNSGPLMAVEADTTAFNTNVLQWTDEDNPATDITYTVAAAPVFGNLQLTAGPVTDLSVGDTFTQDDVDSGRLSYNNTSQSTSDSFTYTVTDGAIPVALSSASPPFQIDIQLITDTPQLSANDINVPAGLESSLAPQVTVVDTDTAQADITLTLTTLPVNGHIESGSPRVTLGLNDTFTAAQISNTFYVHDQGVNDLNGDTFTLMVSDGDAATADSSADVTVVIDARTDNPTSQGTLTATLDGYLDEATSRDNDTDEQLNGTPPWNSLSMTGVIDYESGPLFDPNRGPIEFTLQTTPSRGVLLLNGTELNQFDSFSQAQVDAGQLRYENREFNNANDTFQIQADDDVLQSSVDTVLITRQINAISDVGWVIDSSWTDGGTACRVCHATGGSSPIFTTSSSAGGTIQCSNTQAAYSIPDALPAYPGPGTLHGGGNVIGGPTTNPRIILQQWQDEGFPRPAGCP